MLFPAFCVPVVLRAFMRVGARLATQATALACGVVMRVDDEAMRTALRAMEVAIVVYVRQTEVAQDVGEDTDYGYENQVESIPADPISPKQSRSTCKKLTPTELHSSNYPTCGRDDASPKREIILSHHMVA